MTVGRWTNRAGKCKWKDGKGWDWVGGEIDIVVRPVEGVRGWRPGNGVYGWRFLTCFAFLYIVVRWEGLLAFKIKIRDRKSVV